MVTNRFDSSHDPAFDLRAAELSQAATAQQQESTSDGEHPGAIEHTGDDLLSAAEDGLLAVATPAAAPVVAAVAAGQAVLDAGTDAYDLARDATDAIGDVFGGGDEHPGESTFPVDPDAAPESDEEYAAKMQHAKEEMDKGKAAFDKSVRLWDERHDGVQELDLHRHGDPLGDIRLQDSSGIDSQVAVGAAPNLDLEPHVVGSGAIGGAVTSAPAGAMESVAALSPEVAIGASDATGAPDNATVPVEELRDHVAIGAQPAVQVTQLPTADHAPATVPFGSDVQLNPQPIPPGIGADIGEPAAAHEAAGGGDSSIIIVGGTPSASAPHDMHGEHVGSFPPIGTHVQAHPQPIGAEIGEPAAPSATGDHVPSAADASIIIVGGAGAGVAAHDAVHVIAVDVAPAEHDVASALEAHEGTHTDALSETPAFHGMDIHEAPHDASITADELDG